MNNARSLKERCGIDSDASNTSNLFWIDFRRQRKDSCLGAFGTNE